MVAARAAVAQDSTRVPPGHLLHQSAGAEAGRDRAWHGMLGAQAIGVVTHAAPAFDHQAYTEGYLTQPVVTGHLVAPGGWLQLIATLNLEGVTLQRGELNAGIWGEGYVDRRHPHTLVHEAIASVTGALPWRDGAWSVSAGKGFVPFGSDDPMSRPLEKFPANHHLSQILERYVAIAGLRAGPVVLEAATFNGDEPAGPYRWPVASRFGDSWAVRATYLATPGVSLSASTATVESPENAVSHGLDQRKWHTAIRLQRGAPARSVYLLAEAARTDDRDRGRRAYRVQSLLAEGAVTRGGWELAGRLERSDRPEEERLVDPFRSPRPAPDNGILGVTRWEIATVALSRRLDGPGGLRAAPFLEGSLLQASSRVANAVFIPADFYGSARQWSLSAGLRVGWGMRHARMGRYGVAAAGGAALVMPPGGMDQQQTLH